MNEFDRLKDIVARLRGEGGCPWDRQQTHQSLKPTCIEEAAEVICGINIWEKTGDAANLKEELGDLLLQVVLHAQIAEEEGLFTLEEVCHGISEKMIRRHPHVFHTKTVNDAGEVVTSWEEIKKAEKAGKLSADPYLPEAFDEAKELIDVAKKRKGWKDGDPFFKSIIDQDRCAVVICNLEDEIIYMNPAAQEDYAKWGGGKLVGRSLLDCHNPESRERIRQVTAWFAEDESHNIVYTFHNEKQNKDVYMVALRDGGKLIGYYEKHEYRNGETMKPYDLW